MQAKAETVENQNVSAKKPTQTFDIKKEEKKLITNKSKRENEEVGKKIIEKREVPKVKNNKQESTVTKPLENFIDSNEKEEVVRPQKTIVEEVKDAPIEKITQPARNKSELEQILEAALSTDLLKEELFTKNRVGEFHQLVMQTNRKFDDLIDIEFAGKKVIVIASRYSGSFNIIGGEFIDIQELMLSGDNASLGFIYNSIEVKIDLTKTDDGWVTKNAIKDHKQEDYAEREALVQLMLDDSSMKKVALREEDGKYKSLSLLANGHFSNMLEVSFDGKKLETVPFKYNRAYDRNTTYVEVTKFQVKRKKASLEFSYNKNNFKVNYRMKNGQWNIQSFTKSSR